ncbi:MFS general substrate transporter [Neoconidiobolus thromboides FSU 785]|nr:MFS general substrate transporter [Neoconidiobolus thromboides FSU 785]
MNDGIFSNDEPDSKYQLDQRCEDSYIGDEFKISLILSNLIPVLDNIMVSTAFGPILNELGGLNLITWVGVAYSLTSTAMLPLYGRLSDIFGRKPSILFSLTFFLIGTIACGTTQNIILFIIFRAICGIGGGGLIAISAIILSDIVPIKTRGLYMSAISTAYGLASIVAPLIGGSFSDGLSWRWAFYINVPICIVTMVVFIVSLKVPSKKENLSNKLLRIDYLGSLTLIGANICIILGLNWAGKEYTWSSAPVLSTIVIGILMYIFFGIIELKFVKEPIIPVHILNRNTICANLVDFFNGFSSLVTVYYIPLYYQVVKGKSTLYSGIEILPFLLGTVFGAMFTGIFITKTKSYRIMSMVGSFSTLLGVTLFGTLLRLDITRAEEIIYTLLIGLGVGICAINSLIICQCAVEEKDVAIITAVIGLSFPLGSILGLAIQGSIFSTVLISTLAEKLPNVNPITIISSSNGISSLTPNQIVLVQESYLQGIKYSYLLLILFASFTFISSLFVKHIPFREGCKITVK